MPYFPSQEEYERLTRKTVMNSTIEIKGSYKQTFEPFPHFRWSHGGPFDLKQPVNGASYSQQIGPLTVTVSADATGAHIGVSAFGFSQQYTVAKIPAGGLPFKFTLDHGNYVEGTLTVGAV